MENDPKGKSKKKTLIAIVVGVIVVIGVSVFVINSLPKTKQLEPPGVIVTIKPNNAIAIELNTSQGGTLSGQLNTTNGVIILVANPTDYAFDYSNGDYTSYSYSSEYLLYGSFSMHIGKGIWYVLIDNPSHSSNTTIAVGSFTFTS